MTGTSDQSLVDLAGELMLHTRRRLPDRPGPRACHEGHTGVGSSKRFCALVLLACSIICFAALQRPGEVRLPVWRDVGSCKKSASAG